MAQKKAKTNETTATINFRCSPELKRAVETLVFAGRFATISDFLIAILTREVEHNRQLIDDLNQKRYDVNSAPVNLPPKPKRTGKKKQAAPMNAANVEQDKGGDIA